MTHDEMIAVIQAHKDGKKLEYRTKGMVGWDDVTNVVWSFHSTDYRVKPEPRTFWVNVYPTGEKFAYETKEDADGAASRHRKECIEVVEKL